MVIKRYLLLLLSLLSVAVAIHAGEVDELLAEFSRKPSLSTANRFFDVLSREEFTENHIQFGDNVPLDSARQRVWYWAAEWYNDAGEYQLAAEYGLKALPLCEKSKNEEVLADCHNLLGVIYIRLADYPKAAHHAYRCYQLDKASGDSDRMSSSLNTLAAIYMSARQLDEAERYTLMGIAQGEKANNPRRLAILYGRASEVYHAKGDEQKSYNYARKALDLELKSGNKSGAAVRQVQMAAPLFWLGRYDEAEAALSEAIPQLREDGNAQSLSIAYNQMGNLLLKQGRNGEAVDYFSKAIRMLSAMGDPYNESHAQLGMYRALKDSVPKEALKHMERYKALKDSIYDSDAAMSLAMANAKIGNDDLQASNASLQRWIYIGIGLLVVMMLIALCIWWQYRRRARRAIEENRRLSERLSQLSEEYRNVTNQLDKAISAKPLPTTADSEPHAGTAPTNEFVDRVVSCINKLIDKKDISSDSLAEALKISTYQLRERIKELTNDTPMAMIQAVRMARARNLLDSNPEISISELADRCAYNETANFTRAFKNAYGVTPSQYRKKLLSGK